MGPSTISDLVPAPVAIALTAVVAAIGASIIVRLRKDVNECCPTNEDLLAEFREAFEQGEISEDEYRKIESTLRRPGSGGGTKAGSPPLPTLPKSPAVPGDDLTNPSSSDPSPAPN